MFNLLCKIFEAQIFPSSLNVFRVLLTTNRYLLVLVISEYQLVLENLRYELQHCMLICRQDTLLDGELLKRVCDYTQISTKNRSRGKYWPLYSST